LSLTIFAGIVSSAIAATIIAAGNTRIIGRLFAADTVIVLETVIMLKLN
jgi:hypothetical protein